MVVVGAGAFGAWTAYHLKRAGARVLLIDQHGAGNSRSSSGDETRIIRMSYGSSEIYTRSSMRSLELWKDVCPSLFHNTGVLVTAAPTDPYLIASRETLSRCGVRHDYLKHAALRKQFPQFALDRDTAGVWEPDSGVLMARRAVQAVVEASGADYEIRAGDTKIRAGAVVYACGPWLPKLFPEILRGRIRPTRQEVFYFGTPPGYKSMPGVVRVSRSSVYSIPALDGRGFKIGFDSHGPAFDPETGDREITAGNAAQNPSNSSQTISRSRRRSSSNRASASTKTPRTAIFSSTGIRIATTSGWSAEAPGTASSMARGSANMSPRRSREPRPPSLDSR